MHAGTSRGHAPHQGDGIILKWTLLAVIAFLFFAASAQAHRPRTCSKLEPRAELRCAKVQLHAARWHLRTHRLGRHSRGYWVWRERVAFRWVSQAVARIELPATNDWQTAVRIVQRTWPGTATFLLNCSAHEGGHGMWVWNGEQPYLAGGPPTSYSHGYRTPPFGSSGAGGPMQYMLGTFDAHYSGALALARGEHRPVPPAGLGWTSPLAQAFAGGWGYRYQRSAWTGDPYC